MTSERAGRLVRQPTGYSAFVPASLPPPDLRVDGSLLTLLSEADRALGRLDGVGASVPDINHFLYAYVRREALLSSQIEGTQATLIDVLEFEASRRDAAEPRDVRDVINYINALNTGIELLHTLPLSRKFLCDTHSLLMHGVRGGEPAKTPGEFRRSQNWWGGTSPATARFVPPPHHELGQIFSDFEKFLHDGSHGLPPLVQIGLAHAQFETIHPFLDGNGRMGRLLITFWLIEHGLLHQPLLYISLFLKQHRDTYYERLQAVRVNGDWEGWLAFFLEAVVAVATEAASTAQRIHGLREVTRAHVTQRLGKRVGHALRVLDHLFSHPVIVPSTLEKLLGVSQPTASALVNELATVGVLSEVTGRKKNRIFVFRAYTDLFPEVEVDQPGAQAVDDDLPQSD